MKTVRYQALKRALTGAASAAVILWAIGGEAQASVDCDALHAATFGYTNPGPALNTFSGSLNGGQVFTLDPGDTLSFNVFAGPNSIITISFAGQNVTVDNSAGGGILSQTVTIVTPNTGGSSSGTINFSGQVLDAGVGVALQVDCASTATPPSGGASDAAQSAAQADTVVQTIVPGGIDGNLFGDFGIPVESPLRAFGIHDPAFRGPDADCANRIAKLQASVQRAQNIVQNSHNEISERTAQVAAAASSVERAKQELAASERARELAGLVRDNARREANDFPNRENRAEYHEALQASVAAGFALEDAQRSLANAERDLRKAEEVLAQSRSRLEGFESDLAQAERELAEAEASCRDGASSASLSAPASLAPSPLPLLAFAPIAPDPGRLFAEFNLASERRAVEAAEGAAGRPEGLLGDERFNVWVNGGITFHRDRTGAGQEGETYTFGTGASWRFTPDINAGAAFRFARTDRDGSTGFTEADTWSFALFAQTKLIEEVTLNAIASYSRVDLDLGFKTGGIVTATGSTKADSLAGQLTVTRSFRLGDWQVTPNLGASIVNISRDAFTRSDAVAVPASDSTQVSVSGGPTVSTTISWTSPKGEEITVSPSFGLQAYANLGKFDSVAGAGGARTENDTIGLSANAGLGADLGGGVTLGLGTSWAGIGADRQNISLSAQLTIPLN